MDIEALNLPEVLEEAADKYAHSLGYDEEKDKAEITGAKEDFVAGVEWMAGQRVICEFEAVVKKHSGTRYTSVHIPDSKTALYFEPEVLSPNDKVIVQIRKK